MPNSVILLTGSISRSGGGVSQAVRGLARCLVRRDVALRVLALRDEHSAVDRAAWSPAAPEICVGWPGGFSPQLGNLLRDASEGVLHQHGIWQLWSRDVLKWGRRTGGPVVISPHGMLDAWALRNSTWKKRVATALYEGLNLRSSACLHALNESEAASIRALGLTNPVAIIPNGVDLPLDGRPFDRPALLNGDDRNVLLFLGRIHPKKGIGETLHAWAELLRREPGLGRKWTVVIAGWDDGSHLKALKASAAALGLQGHVHFLGPQFGDDKAALLAIASAFILASHSEGLPLAVLEAWAHRLPVFMTRACNLPEAFAAGAAVEISTRPADLAQTLLERLDDPSLPQVGQAGRVLVEERFTWDRAADEMTSVYRWLLTGGPAPRSVLTSQVNV